MNQKTVTLEITLEEAQLIFNGLGELKASAVFNLLNKLQQQMYPQMQEPAKEEKSDSKG